MSGVHFRSVDSHSPGLISVLGRFEETPSLTPSRVGLDHKESSKEASCIDRFILSAAMVCPWVEVGDGDWGPGWGLAPGVFTRGYFAFGIDRRMGSAV